MNFLLNKVLPTIIAILFVCIPCVYCWADEAPKAPLKASPSGIWCLLPSDQVKNPAMDRMQNSPTWTNDNIDGIVLRQQWEKLEPKEGEIDFTYFDRGLELAKKHNKRVQILVSAGRHSPSWVYAADQSVQKYSTQTTTGFQMLLATFKLKGTLEQALATAIAMKAHFVEVYEPDCIDPDQQPVLAKARLALQENK